MTDQPSYVKTFRGQCLGVGLRPRGPGDPHILFELLVEDDGNWGISDGAASTAWLPELRGVLAEAEAWLGRHAERDGRYGWRFRAGEEGGE